MQNTYPSLSERVQSILIDQVFIILLMFLFADLLDRYEQAPDWIRVALFFGLWAVYEPICMVVGCTLGNYFKKLRVRRYAAPDKRMNLLQAYTRYLVKVLLGWISFITISMNKERRAIHDMAAGSLMIKLK